MAEFCNCCDHSIVQQGDLFPEPSDLRVLVDCSILREDEVVDSKTTIAWIVESPAILEVYQPGFQRELKDRLEKGNHNFSKLYTYDPAYQHLPNVVKLDFCPASTWIEKENRKIHNKTKLISYIASGKNMTALQRKRSILLEHLSQDDRVDVYGRHINPLDKKSDGLIDYCFSYAIENCRASNYFTEKIVDCFLTGTIPIYAGDPDIDKIFDARGIIKIEELENKVLSRDFYESMMPYIQSNFERAMNIKNEFRDQIRFIIEDYKK